MLSYLVQGHQLETCFLLSFGQSMRLKVICFSFHQHTFMNKKRNNIIQLILQNKQSPRGNKWSALPIKIAMAILKWVGQWV